MKFGQRMQIQFGLHLDGLDPSPPVTSLGQASLGPKGLLAALESDLGLPPTHPPTANATVALQACLVELDRPSRFYHRSFQVDPVGVANTLNHWRAQWYEAGWRGEFQDGAPARLQDMADLEQLAKDRVPMCIGQRLQLVCDALTRRHTQIEQLALLTPFDVLPFMWQQLVNALSYINEPNLALTVNAENGSDLSKVQRNLLSAHSGEPPSEKTQLSQDGSLLIVNAASRDVSAQALAEVLRADSQDTLVIAEQHGIILDNALHRAGLARCGLQHYSSFRAITQILKLSLALLWAPVNPHALLQFLIHPAGPLPLSLRRPLAEAVSDEPGIGGQAWQANIQRLVDQIQADPDAADHLKRLHSDLATWFEDERFDPISGVPMPQLQARIQLVQSWLAARAHSVEDEAERKLYGVALTQAQTLAIAVTHQTNSGRTHLPRLELERLVDEVTQGQPDPHNFAEVGHVQACTHPSAVTQPWHQVIWWNLEATKQSNKYPWSARELDALSDAGVSLLTMQQRLRQQSTAWLQPLCNAQQRCVLVIHHTDEGSHPLHTQLTGLFDGLLTLDLEEVLWQGQTEIPHLKVPLQSEAVQPLPEPRRWWQLSEETQLPPRDRESYSSLSKLFYSPHEWVLNYKAKLRPGRAQDLSDGPRLYGTLAHRLFEQFFAEHSIWRSMGSEDINAWANQTVPKLIEREGALLLEPGRGNDYETVTFTLTRGLLLLVEHFKAADIDTVRVEHAVEAPSFSNQVNLNGHIDLLLKRADGREVVVDAKWGGEEYRAAELEENLHLQLASYAYMRKHETGANQWPEQAYFIITEGNMLAQNNGVFPQARVFTPEPGSSIDDLWQKSERTFDWRRAQLNDGRIEVNAPGTAATEASQPEVNMLNTLQKPSPWDDYVNLTGWDTFA